MASLGIHDDWRRRFPKVRPLKKGEVATAWPWVPIRYAEAYAAHQARIERFLAGVPKDYRGVLFNDLQGGPASCGCGNLQCRWATDYGVPSTGTKLTETDVAARFVAQVRKAHRDKEIIPVWTTECEKEDLPLAKLPKGSWTTGYCGTVPCLDYCRKRFGEQWTALQADRGGPTGLLLLHREFQRDRKEYGGPATWLTAAVAMVRKQGPEAVPPRNLQIAWWNGFRTLLADHGNGCGQPRRGAAVFLSITLEFWSRSRPVRRRGPAWRAVHCSPKRLRQ